MAKRIVTKIGNVFCVEFDNGTKGYFQYIAIDKTMLGSSVIRAFKTHYPIDRDVAIDDIVKDEVAFYAHTVLKVGIVYGTWYKVGKSMDLGTDELEKVIFGYTHDTKLFADNPKDDHKEVDPRSNWIIWQVNKKIIKVGTLSKKLSEIVELGDVVPYSMVKSRMERGYYRVSSFEYEFIKRKPRPEYRSYVRYKIDQGEILLCFLGDGFEKEIIIKNGNISRITREDAILNNLKLADRRLSDTNWEYNDFITEKEFNQVWNKQDQ